MKSNPVQQIPSKPRFFVKAPRSGAFTKNLGLVCSQSAVAHAQRVPQLFGLWFLLCLSKNILWFKKAQSAANFRKHKTI